MLLARGCVVAILSWAIVAYSPVRADIPSAEELDDVFAFKTVIYNQDDGADNLGGNADIDEDASIVEGVILIRKRVGKSDVVSLELLGDMVSAASYDAARENAELVSGATGSNIGRYSIAPGWGRRYDSWRFDLHVSYALEYAYRSTGFGGTFSTQLTEGATTISGGLQVYNDTVRVIRFDGSKEPDQPRDTYTLSLELTQSLTPHSALNLGVTHTQQDGFLATSFNSVRTGITHSFEIVPDRRRRDGVSLRYKQAVGQQSYELGTSYYEDDWGIEAVTLSASYFHPFASDYLLVPNHRYYTQDAADFFAGDFNGGESYRSSDPDLGDFDGQTVGVLLKIFNVSFDDRADLTYDIGLNYYKRSDDLNFYWLTLGVTSPL